MPNLAETRKILEKPVSRNLLSKAIEQEKWIQFHTKVSEKPEYLNDFKKWVKKLIPKDVYEVFEALLVMPVDTIKTTNEAFNKLNKVFSSKNPVFKYEFKDREYKIDFTNYLENTGFNSWWPSRGFEASKYRINSFIAIDLPIKQIGPRPEPYMYIIDLSNVVDFNLKGDKVEWIIFKAKKGYLHVYDTEAYRVYKTVDDHSNEIDFLVSESFHDLNECPVKTFWNDSLDAEMYFIKESPISNLLSFLNWILMFSVSKRYNDLYSPFPVYWGYQSECEYTLKSDNHHYECRNGLLVDERGHGWLDKDSHAVKCPSCSTKLRGVGAYVEVPMPEEGDPTITPPVGRIDVDKASLDYNIEEYERMIKEFHQSVTGSNMDVITTQAINKDHVMSIFESMKQALTKYKKNFEIAHEWAVKVMAKLRYGDLFVSCNINYGTDWYLFSEDVYLNMYQDARAKGLDAATLDYLQDQYFETKYKNNQSELERTKIMSSIDPFRHLTLSEVNNLRTQGIIQNLDYYIKANLSSLIMRFERENTNIVQFGKELDFKDKINRINAELAKYYNPVQVEPQTV